MRTKDARIDDAILAATIELLDEIGYQTLTIGAVASRAGVHRPAVYRRWASKRHLVVDAVASQMGVAPTPDTGDLRADLIAGIATWCARCPEPRRACASGSIGRRPGERRRPRRRIPRPGFRPTPRKHRHHTCDRPSPAATSARTSTSTSCSTRSPHRCTTAFSSATCPSATGWPSRRYRHRLAAVGTR